MATSFENNLKILFSSLNRPVVSPFSEGEAKLFQQVAEAPKDAVLFLDLPRPDYSVEVAHAAAASSGRAFVLGNKTNTLEVRKSMRSVGLNLFQVSGSEGEEGHIFGTPTNLGDHPALVPFKEPEVEEVPGLIISIRKSQLQTVESPKERRLVTGVAMAAHEVDGEGEWFSDETCLDSMIDYMVKSRNVGFEHVVDINNDVDIIENWQLRDDTQHAGKLVRKGSWMMTLRIYSDRYWNAYKNGTLAGFSVGGKGYNVSTELEEVPA
jgi:hypothetical protein